MKTRFPSILGVFAAILMVASFVVPMNIAAPSPVSADPGIMKWDTVITPGSFPAKNDIFNPYWPEGGDSPRGGEILDMAIGNDGITYAWIVKTFVSDLVGNPPWFTALSEHVSLQQHHGHRGHPVQRAWTPAGHRLYGRRRETSQQPLPGCHCAG